MEHAETMLARNNACHQCRKRKLRCSGVRPVCSHCSRRQVKKANQGTSRNLDCTWDDAKKAGPSKSSQQVVDVVLPEPEAEFMAIFEQASRSTHPHLHPIEEVALGGPSLAKDDAKRPVEVDVFDFENGGSLAWEADTGLHPVALGQTGDTLDWLGTLTRSDWPPELPRLDAILASVLALRMAGADILQHFIDVFFDAVPTWPRMLRKPAILHDITFSPTHTRFTAYPLLHAILCITAPYMPSSVMTDHSYWPAGTLYAALRHPEHDHEVGLAKPPEGNSWNLPAALHLNGKAALRAGSSPLLRFQIWHRRQALEGTTLWSDQGKHFLQLLQAIILVTAADQMNAWWDDVWALSGTCMRFAMPLKIHESPLLARKGMSGFAACGCPDVDNTLELAGMARTWWMAYLIERSASMWTTWPSGLPDDEISVELPVLQSIYEAGYGDLLGSQTITDEKLWSSHPAIHQDPLVYQIKAVKLFVDIRKFIRVYQRKEHSIERYSSEPDFRLSLSRINTFRLSLPAIVRTPTGSITDGVPLDREALVTAMISHAAMIVLGEPFLTVESWQDEVGKLVLAAIRSNLSYLYDIIASSYDLARLPASVSYILYLSAKALLRVIQVAGQAGQPAVEAVLRSELAVFEMALRQFGEKFPIGERHVKMLEDDMRLQSPGPRVGGQLSTILEATISPSVAGAPSDPPSASTPSLQFSASTTVSISAELSETPSMARDAANAIDFDFNDILSQFDTAKTGF